MIAAASDPASGSVVASAVAGGAGPHSGGSQRSRCSAEPSASSGPAKNPPWEMQSAIGLSPQVSSSITRSWSTRLSTPPPPYSAGRS